MLIWLSPASPHRHHFVVLRPPWPRIEALLETRSLLLHDLCHYAVEAALGTDEGFYGRVAQGADPTALREATMEDAEWASLLAIEGQVVQLQSAFKRRDAEQIPGFERLRQLWGAWSKVRPPMGLRLAWPADAPIVAPDPRDERPQ
ncbi:MAG: hypothetical protein AAGA48_03510 [Myxococcota bacterium]